MTEHPYSYKPRPKFFGDGSVFLGLELEVEAPDHTKKREGLDIERDPAWCYAKHDGSLSSTGWEMVTHPISMNFWMSREDTRTYSDYHDVQPGTILTGKYKGVTYTAEMLHSGRVRWNGTSYRSISACAKAICNGTSQNGYRFFGLIQNHQPNPVGSFFRLVGALKNLGYSSHDGGRCGFHVHVSRTAFGDEYGNLHTPMFYRFKCLINGLLFRKLSQRTDFNYCQQEPVDVHTFYRQHWNRRMAIHITEKTVEVRIFRGNLRECRLRKNIEAVIAAIEFSREWYPTLTDGGRALDPYIAPTDEQFTEYVRARRHRFPNLVVYIDLMSTPTLNNNSDPEEVVEVSIRPDGIEIIDMTRIVGGEE